MKKLINKIYIFYNSYVVVLIFKIKDIFEEILFGFFMEFLCIFDWRLYLFI